MSAAATPKVDVPWDNNVRREEEEKKREAVEGFDRIFIIFALLILHFRNVVKTIKLN